MSLFNVYKAAKGRVLIEWSDINWTRVVSKTIAAEEQRLYCVQDKTNSSGRNASYSHGAFHATQQLNNSTSIDWSI